MMRKNGTSAPGITKMTLYDSKAGGPRGEERIELISRQRTRMKKDGMHSGACVLLVFEPPHFFIFFPREAFGGDPNPRSSKG